MAQPWFTDIMTAAAWFAMPFFYWGFIEFMLWAENDFVREPKKEKKKLREYLRRLLKGFRA